MRPLPEGAKPPGEVRFRELRVEPWPDGRRARVHITLTPFIEYPSLEVMLLDDQGDEITRVDIIESAEHRIVFTMHIRFPSANGRYQLHAVLLYPETGPVDTRTLDFELGPASSGEA